MFRSATTISKFDLGSVMASLRTHTIRKHISTKECMKIRENLSNTQTWPDWHRGAKGMFATQAGTLEKGHRIALHQLIKGALIESRWIIDDVREDQNFYELVMLFDGQSRMERTTASGIENYRISITILLEDEGGVEIYSSWHPKGLAKLFSKNMAAFVTANANQLLEDLSSIV